MARPAPQVLCLGEALVDRLGPPGADPADDSAACEDRLGGAPANVACALARLGTAAAYAGRLGQDAIGMAFARLFADRGVDISALQWDDRRPSRIVLVRREASGERQFGGFAGDGRAGFADQALAACALAAALEPLLLQARWLLLGTIPLASPASAEAAWTAVRRAAAVGLPVAVDVNWRPTFWNSAADPAAAPTAAQIQTMLPLLRQSRLLKCALEEARWLFGRTDPAAISAALPHQPLVVVTDGAAPLRWGWAGAPPQTLAPLAVAVVDSTGAGDAFSAGLLHRLCAEPALLQADHPAALVAAMRFAAACGALVCQGAGAIDPQADDAQVRAFLATRG